MAFAMLPVMALLPIGLNINRQAVESTVSAQIVGRVTHEVQQTDYLSLPASNTPLTYAFDDQGSMLASGSTGSLPILSGTVANSRIYSVLAIVYKPSVLPSTAGIGTTQSLARVRIDIVTDPTGNAIIDSGTFQKTNVATYFAFVSKND